MTDQEMLQKAYDVCTVEKVPNGHKATFLGQSFVAQSDSGPDINTELLAKKGAVFCRSLREWEKDWDS